MDGTGKCIPSHFEETKPDAVGKVLSRPMLPALIALAPGPRPSEACYNANFFNAILVDDSSPFSFI